MTVVQLVSLVGMAMLRDRMFAMNPAQRDSFEDYYVGSVAALLLPILVLHVRKNSARPRDRLTARSGRRQEDASEARRSTRRAGCGWRARGSARRRPISPMTRRAGWPRSLRAHGSRRSPTADRACPRRWLTPSVRTVGFGNDGGELNALWL